MTTPFMIIDGVKHELIINHYEPPTTTWQERKQTPKARRMEARMANDKMLRDSKWLIMAVCPLFWPLLLLRVMITTVDGTLGAALEN